MKEDFLEKKVYEKEMELNALLEITQAVNNNLPEEDIYQIFKFILRANLFIKKMALYVHDDAWDCKVQFGTSKDFKNVEIGAGCLQIEKTTKVKEVDLEVTCFSEFDIIIPVKHKDRLLAFVFLKAKEGEEVDTTFIQALSNVILVAIENKRLARKQLEQQAIQRDVEIARNVQNYLFPKDLPKTEKLEIAAFYQPCRTVGGDYYDFIPLEAENQFVVAIADVSGKGVPAAILMSNFQAALRTVSRTATSPQQVIEELNFQLVQSANGENFITFFLAVYDYETKELRYINCGHNPPLLMNGEAKVERLEEGTTVLGAFQPLPFLNMGTIKNLEEFSLFLFTDGLTETFDEEEEEYGTERLEEYLVSHYNEPLDDIHDGLIQELNDFREGRSFDDDLTFLSCRVKNGTA
jgi:sigma-B regulation protein RsbU (phosphoserine phosphatase)